MSNPLYRTPPPWATCPDCDGNHLIYQHGPSLGKTGNTEDCPEVATVYRKADADRIVANANGCELKPDLLAACKASLQFIKQLSSEKKLETPELLLAFALSNQLKAAIHKAETTTGRMV